LGPNERGGLGPNERGGLGPNERGGLGPNERGGLGPNERGGLGPNERGGLGSDVRGFNANRRAMGAPIASEDGHVTIFNSKDFLAETATVSLEALPAVPNLPSYLTPVGQGYRFVASDKTPRTIEFGYLQREVPQGYENMLMVYFFGDDGRGWQRRQTNLDVEDNQATAPADESGLYVLVTTVEVPFYRRGWNLFAYPIPDERPVAEALGSITGSYSTVYGFNSANPDDPWQVYDANAPQWVNDLDKLKLEFGNGYWISVTEPITLRLQVAGGVPLTRSTAPIAALGIPVSRRTPPAVYYGNLPIGLGPDISVTAWIEGKPCGTGHVLPDKEPSTRRDALHYVIKVDAADQGSVADCGVPGKQVSLKLRNVEVATVAWDNTRPISLTLPLVAAPVP